MPAAESTLPPAPLGLAEADAGGLGDQVLAAWDAFLDVVTAPTTDLTRPSRLRGWTGRDACIHLGHWDDAQVLQGVLASAREGGKGAPRDVAAQNARVVEAHRDATTAQVVTALREAREHLAVFFASDDAVTLGRSPSRSAVGQLPVLSLVHAGCYELAVHALDLAPCGAPPPSELLLQRGLAALIDVTGALSAQAGVEIELTAQTPTGGWRYVSSSTGWTTSRVPRGGFEGTGVRGSAADLLDTSAGRTNLAQLLLTRRLQGQQM